MAFHSELIRILCKSKFVVATLPSIGSSRPRRLVLQPFEIFLLFVLFQFTLFFSIFLLLFFLLSFYKFDISLLFWMARLCGRCFAIMACWWFAVDFGEITIYRRFYRRSPISKWVSNWNLRSKWMSKHQLGRGVTEEVGRLWDLNLLQPKCCRAGEVILDKILSKRIFMLIRTHQTFG